MLFLAVGGLVLENGKILHKNGIHESRGPRGFKFSVATTTFISIIIII